MLSYFGTPQGAIYGFAPLPPKGPISQGIDRSVKTQFRHLSGLGIRGLQRLHGSHQGRRRRGRLRAGGDVSAAPPSLRWLVPSTTEFNCVQTSLLRAKIIADRPSSPETGCAARHAGPCKEGVMPLLVASFVNGLFLMGSVKARPCLDTPDETIDGFPEFEVAVENIKDLVARQKLRALAKRIVASHNTPNRIIGFEVHGHADVDLRTPAGEKRQQTELDVSRDRAENAKDLLLQLIEEEGGKPIIAGIKANTATVAVGSRCRKVIPARTEAEMKRNRRVEIFLKEFRNNPRPPEPPPKPEPRPPEQGTNWRIQIKSGTIVTANSPVGEVLGFATIRLNVVITDLDRKEMVDFVATSTGLTIGGSLGASPLPAGTTIGQVREGKPKDFWTTQGVSLMSFQGDLFMGQNPGASVSVLPAGGKFTMSFRAPTRPKVVEVEGGNDPFSLPQASFGVQPADGSLTMQGSPVPAP
jgi:hypothetical protein